jgi:CheY-like chemotaxis protein
MSTTTEPCVLKINGSVHCRASLRRIRQQPWGKDVFLVAVTGSGSEEERRQNQDAGVNAYLMKPVSHDKLKALLNDYALGKRA